MIDDLPARCGLSFPSCRPARPSARLALTARSVLATLAGCSPAPKPVARQRVDVEVGADGRCRSAGRELDCAHAAATLADGRSADTLGIVLKIAPQAPVASVEALQTGLQRAGVRHVQFGDPSTQRLASAPGGGLD